MPRTIVLHAQLAAACALALLAVAATHGGGGARAFELDVWPPTTLLPTGTSSLAVRVNVSETATACRWYLSGDPRVPRGGTLAAVPGSGNRTFAGTVAGLEMAADTPNLVTVSCQRPAPRSASRAGGGVHGAGGLRVGGRLGNGVRGGVGVGVGVDPGAGSGEYAYATVVYRCVPDIAGQPYPKTGNLWGSSNFKGKPLSYAASRVSLWLGCDWNATEIASLRRYNGHTVALTSINACEHGDGLPEHYYLHNITAPSSTLGRLESWPGAFRLDLTQPEVQQYQTQLMYALVVLGGWEGHPFNNGSTAGATTIAYDGLFVDNVFINDAYDINSRDIHNNAFRPCTTSCGCDPTAADPVPDTRACFEANWNGGIYAELQAFRGLMPHALMDGHAMGSNGPSNARVGALFNAISIGFSAPRVVEGDMGFEDAYEDYAKWNDASLVRTPHAARCTPPWSRAALCGRCTPHAARRRGRGLRCVRTARRTPPWSRAALCADRALTVC